MIGYHFYRCPLRSPLTDESKAKSCFWFGDMGETMLVLLRKEG